MKSFIKKNIVILLGLLVVLSTVSSVYFYKKSTDSESKASLKEAEELVSVIGEIALLPTGEIPTVATVSDPEALRDQPFFVDSIKDDKVLIYSNAKKAILYRPSIEKVINIAPLNVGTPKAQPLEASAPSTPAPAVKAPVKKK
ncbi:MAG: hypothetical protein RL687_452 [Candidatus Parcubacteria bacterium]|jgi:hypothetical protein